MEENLSEGEEASISIKVGREALATAKKFLEQREFATENDIRYMRNIIRRLDESVERLPIKLHDISIETLSRISQHGDITKVELYNIYVTPVWTV